ncbi:hypothetical protein ABEB36_004337 [Hypothenemus hampei]|uniref:lysoplasmalogenase n=1 Tax=Hypothenemus hampei TaxID=57062 RepID=A0ABD1F2Z5_HYPHA
MNQPPNQNDFVIVKKLAPFFFCFSVYFVLHDIPYEDPSLLDVAIKCAPIVNLIHFVKSHRCTQGCQYSNRILLGLFFCCAGDIFLMWKSGFLYGMIAFIFGHVQYILAFGFTPLKLKLYFVILPCALFALQTLYQGLSGIFLIGVPIYILIISVMVWRAVARVQNNWTYLQIGTCVGSILFAISDTFIGVETFISPVAYSNILIMATYYIAQLGISLSVLEDPHLNRTVN